MKVEAARESPPKGERITHSMEEWGKPLQDFMEEKRSPVELDVLASRFGARA